MKNIAKLTVLGVAGFALSAGAGYVNDGFESYPLGQAFTTPLAQWQSSSAGVVVTNAWASSGTQSVVLPAASDLSNSVAISGPSVMWTDVRTVPVLGFEGNTPPTNGCSYASYVDEQGYLNVWTANGWVVCSNDVWGGLVAAVTNGAAIELSICQNFAAMKTAVLLNDRLVLQDQPIPAGMTNYNALVAENVDGTAYLDDVYIQAAYPPGRLTNDLNGNGVVDALELQQYGYAARVLAIGPTNTYATFAAALAVARARDVLLVNPATYTGDISLNGSWLVVGAAFTNRGDLVLGAYTTNTIQPDLTFSNLVVGTNAVGAFGGNVTCSNVFAYLGSRVSVAGLATVASNVVAGDAVALAFSNDVTVGSSLSAGAAAALVGASNVTVRTGLALGQGATGTVHGALTAGIDFVLGTNAVASVDQALICTNLTAYQGAQLVGRGTALVAGSLWAGDATSLSFSNTLTAGGLVLGQSSTGLIHGALSAGNDIVLATGAVLRADQSLACTNLTIGPRGRSTVLGTAVVAGALAADDATTLGFSNTLFVGSTIQAGAGALLACASNVTTGAGMTLGQGSTGLVHGAASIGGDMTAGSGALVCLDQTLACTNLAVGQAARFSVAGAATVTGTLTAGVGSSLGFSNTLGVAGDVQVGAAASLVCGASVACGAALMFGQGATGTFAGAVTTTGGVSVGTNAVVAFNQALVCSNLVVSAGASAVFGAVTCSNLVVESGATVRFLGAFACAADATVAGGATVGFSNTVVCGNALTVATGASVTFQQSVAAASLSALGTISMGNNASLALATATVYGSVQANAATVTVTSLSVPTDGTGHLVFVGGHLVVGSANVDLTGTFTIDNTWGTPAVVGLDFTDSFEGYQPNAALQSYGFLGWGASDSSVVVAAGAGLTNSKAAWLPPATVLSNRIASAATKVWTDFYARPNPGMEPLDAPTNGVACDSHVNADGYLAILDSGTWVVCSNYVDGSAVTPMQTNTYTRVTFHSDYVNHRAAVFVAGKLARQLVGFPGGAGVATYTSFGAINREGNAYIDNVLVSPNMPGGLTADLDQDGIADALEIDRYGYLEARPLGSVFKFQ